MPIAALFPILSAPADEAPAGSPEKTQPPALSQADIDRAVSAAVSAESQKFAEAFKASTGFGSLAEFDEAAAKARGEHEKLLAQRSDELEQTRRELAHTRIESAILAAAGAAIDPTVVVALLSHAGKYAGNAVTFGGKTAEQAVADLLEQKPFLAKPAGPSGGGTPPTGGNGSVKTMTRAEFARLDPGSRNKFLADRGRVVD